MLAIVTSLALPLLFTGSATLALVVLGTSWKRHVGTFARLRAELAACSAQGEAIGGAIRVSVTQPGPANPTLPAPRRAARPVRAAAVARPAPAGLRAAA